LVGCGGGGGGTPTPNAPNLPAANTPPTANAGADQLVLTSAAVSLSGASSSDPDGTIATFAWTQTAGPPVTLSSSSTAATSFTAPAAATSLTFQLGVTDNAGATRTDTVVVEVNAPPIANAGADQSVKTGASVTLSGSGSDPNGTIASYAWTQTSGTPVTLTGANTATPTFTAPASAATLAFQLTVTDNQGATHLDAVAIAVKALLAPTIGRQPTSPHSIEYGSALIFVAATGDDLNYEWRYSSGVVAKSGPEPYLLRSSLAASDDGRCFYVVISNGAGSVTSNPGCLSVEALDDEFVIDPSDDNPTDDGEVAIGYGSVLMTIADLAVGVFADGTGPLTYIPIGALTMASAPRSCHVGSDQGSTIDGVAVTTDTPLPLGRHSFSHAWHDCHETSDDYAGIDGALLVTYDFPTVFGEGTFTIHASDYRGLNGVITVTVTRTISASGAAVDDFDIQLGDDLGSYNLIASALDHISVKRTSNADRTIFSKAVLDFAAPLSVYDTDGFAGTAHQDVPGVITLKYEPTGGGDDGVDPYSAEGLLKVGLSVSGSQYHLATLKPGGGGNGWGFNVISEPECPPGYICFDPPTP
ncbi:MAG TPA: PKD domain-containing protein, partial [Vicinamibacterales bacterium]|nr:PKD domain-containing protein [Vicinamibacterales bacterium]